MLEFYANKSIISDSFFLIKAVKYTYIYFLMKAVQYTYIYFLMKAVQYTSVFIKPKYKYYILQSNHKAVGVLLSFVFLLIIYIYIYIYIYMFKCVHLNHFALLFCKSVTL